MDEYLRSKYKKRYRKKYPERFITPKKFKRCARCKKTFYCNEECQKRDWVNHKTDCIEAEKTV